MKPLRILLVAGVGKSGSTLVGSLLGQIPGYLNVGEMISIEHTHREGHLCGCGVPVDRCEFWAPLIAQSIGGLDRIDQTQWRRLHTKALLSWREIWKWLRRANVVEQFGQLGALYAALGNTAADQVVVDGSKSYRYAQILRRLPNVEVRILHLIRDPRAVEYSKSRLLSGGHWKFEQASTLRNTIQWISLNLLLETMAVTDRAHYRRLRYEDLIRSPAPIIAELTRWITGRSAQLDIDSEGAVNLGINHTLGGSDVRHESGRVVLSPRADWVERLPSRKKTLVSLLAFPLLLRYGYPLRGNTT